MLERNLVADFNNYLLGENKSENTVRNYMCDIDMFYDFLNSRNINDLKEVKLSTLTDYKNKFLSIERKNANSTINRRMASVKTFFNYLVIYEILPANVALQIKNSKVPERETIYLKPKQIKKVTTYAKDNITERDYAMLITFLRTGMRLSEVVNMNYDDVEFRKNGSDYQVIGKGNKQRTIFLDSECIEAIKDYCNSDQRKNQLSKRNDEDALFQSNGGNRISISRVEKIFYELFSKVFGKDNNFTIHKLRHTALTMLYEETGDIRAVQEVAGHTDVNTTTIYTHINKDRIRNIMGNRPKLSDM